MAMKRKILIVLLAVFAVLAVLAIVVMPQLVNADRLRPVIEARLGAALGRPVAIGKLRFSWLVGGVAAQDISIADDPAFSAKPFVTAKALDVRVDIWPLLLHREIHIDSIALRQPQVILLQSGNRWNFSSLGAAAPAAPSTGVTAPAPAAAPASAATPASTGAPLPLTLKKFAISNGQITMQQPGSAQTYSDLNINASNVSLDSSFPFSLSAKMPGNGQLTLEGKAGPAPKEDFAQMPVQATVKVEHLNVAAYAQRGTRIGGTAGFTADLRSDGRLAHLEGSTKIENLVLDQGGTPIPQPVTFDFAADYTLATQAGKVTRGDAHVDKSVVHLTGSFQTQGGITALNFTLAAPGLLATDIEKILKAMAIALPGGASLKSGTATVNQAVNGPTNALVISGPVHVENLIIAGFNLGSKMHGIASLAGMQTGPDTRVESFDTKVRVANEGIRLDDMRAVIAGVGTVTGGGTIGADHKLNLQLAAQLGKGGGALGGLLQAASGQQGIPFRVEGTTDDPKFIPDMSAMTHKVPLPGKLPVPQNNPAGNTLNSIFGKKKK
jgi:AsmA protein